MKAHSGFILRNLAGEYVLAPVGQEIKSFNGVAVMNEMCAFVWEKLQSDVSGQELLSAILDEYDTDEATASEDLDVLLRKMRAMGVIED